MRPWGERENFISDLKKELTVQREAVELFNLVFKRLKEFFSFKHAALLVFDKNHKDFLFVKEVGLKRQAQFLSLQAERFWKCLKTHPQGGIWKGKEIFFEYFTEFKQVAVFPILRGKELIGSFILGVKEEDFPSSLFQAFQHIWQEVGNILRHLPIYKEDIELLKPLLAGRVAFGLMVGKSKAMQAVYELVEDVAKTDATVLIQGETGTGKELLAITIHQKSHRKNGPFVVAHCSAYPQTLIESELFGHEKGAFTGAIRQKRGRFELAHKGTLFLDEIGEIPESTQVLLLRVIETGEFERIGGERTIKADVRIIAATNKDLREEVEKGHFRQDLYFRLNVVTINLPPLRERREDIPLLCQHFLHQLQEKTGKVVKDVSPEVMDVFMRYCWPGNVRELRSVLERAFILTKEHIIQLNDLPPELLTFTQQDKEQRNVSFSSNSLSKLSLMEHEKELILKALEETGWNKREAAQKLGISRATLYNKMKKYGLTI